MQDDSVTYDNFIGFGFNRYAYCMYNPLKYVDPSGERHVGYNPSAMYQMEQAMRLEVLKVWQQTYDSWEAKHRTTLNMANSVYSQGNNNMGNGGSGNHGSDGGGGKSRRAFRKMCKSLGIESNKPIPDNLRNNEFLKRFQEAAFPDAPMDYVKDFIVEGLDKEAEFLRGTTWNEAKTTPDWIDGVFSGYSSVYFNEDYVFNSPEDLYYAMGHELIHVGQIVELSGDPKQNWCKGLIYVMDAYAYTWMHDMGRDYGWIKNDTYTKQWQSHKDCLNYINFQWLYGNPHP